MPQSEFDIIEQYFLKQKTNRDDVRLGIGDDAAIVFVPADRELLIALDTLVAGVHFPTNTSAEDIAYKALAVNLSDLAAMGGEPAWFTLALALPESDSDWLAGFAKGLFGLAEQYHMQLVGGDTTRGPLTISIQVAGLVPLGKAIKRKGAKPGDKIYVTGSLGDAALGLHCLQNPDTCPADQTAIQRLNRPQARIDVGLALRDVATAGIDISDGLLSDLGHLLDKSGTGASIDRQLIPLSDSLRQLCEKDAQNYNLVLSAGDDYELCFTAPAEKGQAVFSIAEQTGVPISCIGIIESQTGLRLHHSGQPCDLNKQTGYEHFR